MAVLIKNMEMPAMCSDCPFNSGMCFPKGEYYCECPSRNIQGSKITLAMDEDCRHPDCPLVELPEKHGRLIDANSLENEVCSGCLYKNNKYANCIDCAIANAPTVIEAEGN